MTREEHEALLNELNGGELEVTRRNEILQLLRNDYIEFTTNYEQTTQERDKLKSHNADLVIANSQLFRQLGIESNEDMKKEDEKKTFSETVTLESLEG